MEKASAHNGYSNAEDERGLTQLGIGYAGCVLSIGEITTTVYQSSHLEQYASLMKNTTRVSVVLGELRSARAGEFLLSFLWYQDQFHVGVSIGRRISLIR